MSRHNHRPNSELTDELPSAQRVALLALMETKAAARCVALEERINEGFAAAQKTDPALTKPKFMLAFLLTELARLQVAFGELASMGESHQPPTADPT